MKKTKFTKVLSLLLAVLMLITCLSASMLVASADEGVVENELRLPEELGDSSNVEQATDSEESNELDDFDEDEEVEKKIDEAEIFAAESEGDDSDVLPALVKDEHIKFINGKDGFFKPSAGITRAEASQIFYTLLEEKVDGPANMFTDVGTQWYAEPINCLASLGVLEGYGDEFKPNRNISRAQFVTIISRFFDEDEDESTEVSFTDVPSSSWAYPQIAMAVKNNWVKGYSDGTFKPNNNISRAEAVIIVNRVLGRTGDKATIDSKAYRLFPDVAPNFWAYVEIMEASVEHKHSFSGANETWTSHTAPKSSLSAGTHLVGYELYMVGANGLFVANQTVNGLRFNADCKYTSGDADIDRIVKQKLRANTNDKMSRKDMLKAMYVHTYRDYRYLTGPLDVPIGSSGWELRYAKRMFSTGKSNCYGFAAIYTYFARQLGYEAYGVSGKIDHSIGQGYVYHAWSEIKEDSIIYINDPETEGIFGGKVGKKWDLFMRPYGSTQNVKYKKTA